MLNKFPKIEIEIEKGYTKAKYFLMINVNYDATERESDNNDTSTKDDSFRVLDHENKTEDYSNVRATDIPTCQRIFPQKPASMRRESIMQNIKDKMLNNVEEYKNKHCNNKGWIKTKNVRK